MTLGATLSPLTGLHRQLACSCHHKAVKAHTAGVCTDDVCCHGIGLRVGHVSRLRLLCHAAKGRSMHAGDACTVD